MENFCDAVSWMDVFKKEYPGFVKSNPAKLPKLVVKPPSSMKNAPQDVIDAFEECKRCSWKQEQ